MLLCLWATSESVSIQTLGNEARIASTVTPSKGGEERHIRWAGRVWWRGTEERKETMLLLERWDSEDEQHGPRVKHSCLLELHYANNTGWLLPRTHACCVIFDSVSNCYRRIHPRSGNNLLALQSFSPSLSRSHQGHPASWNKYSTAQKRREEVMLLNGDDHMHEGNKENDKSNRCVLRNIADENARWTRFM